MTTFCIVPLDDDFFYSLSTLKVLHDPHNSIEYII